MLNGLARLKKGPLIPDYSTGITRMWIFSGANAGPLLKKANA